jgi:hypothetical protein
MVRIDGWNWPQVSSNPHNQAAVSPPADKKMVELMV